tara:strand:- start:35 stop:358 length:324 start_codon:yes stop_codon:yes gene_type:complete
MAYEGGTAESLYPERIEDHMSDDEIKEYILEKELQEIRKKNSPPENFMRKSADAVFDLINTPAGKAMLPQAQMLNIIDRILEGSMTQDEMDSLGLTANPGGKPSKQY